jgi:hypothetical protein
VDLKLKLSASFCSGLLTCPGNISYFCVKCKGRLGRLS